MSWIPKPFGNFSPIGRRTPPLLASYHTISSSFPVPPNSLVVPARHAYSHWASVGRLSPIFLQSLKQSVHPTFSTGKRSPLNHEGSDSSDFSQAARAHA